MEKNQFLVLIRGVPGAGKSTTAKMIKHRYSSLNFQIFEADDYFITDKGYKFDPTHIKDAHRQCFSNTLRALKNGDNVIVSNTFTRKWELEQYIELAKELGVKLKIFRANGRYKNVHNVPDDVVNGMLNRFEDVDGEILLDNR